MREWRPTLSLGCVALIVSLVSFSAAKSPWLKWDAPPECPGVAHLEARLSEWLGRTLDPDIDLEVRASITWKEGAWEVQTHFVYRGQVGERQVRVDTCTEAVDFVALTVALAVDPGFEGQEGQPGSAGADGETAPVSGRQWEEDGRSAGAASGGLPAEKSEGSVQASTTNEAPRVATAPKSEGKGETESVESDSERADYRWFGAISAVGAGGVLPGFSLGPKGTLGFRAERVYLAIAVSYLVANAQDVDASNLVSSNVLSTHLEGCFLLGDRPAWGPCLGGQLGALSAREISASPSAKGESGLWGAVSIGGKLVWHWSRVLGALVTADLVLPLASPHFVLSSQREVFSPSPGFQGNLGLMFGF